MDKKTFEENNIKKKFCSISPKIKNKKLENISDLDKYKNKLKKVTIKNEIFIVNALHKNIANNLLFSRLTNKRELSNINYSQNKQNGKMKLKLKPLISEEINENNQNTKKKVKLKPLINEEINENIQKRKNKLKLKPLINEEINENIQKDNPYKNYKNNIKTQQISFNNSEKDISNSNSNIKTYRSIKTNTIGNNNNHNEVEEDDINYEEEKIIPINNFKTIEENYNNNKNNDNLYKSGLAPINKKVFKKNKSNLEIKYFSNEIINNYNDFFLFQSFSSRNNILNKKNNKKKFNLAQFHLQNMKKNRYKIMKEKIINHNFCNE